MPTGVYERTQAVKAMLIQRVNNPEAKARATAARKASRVRVKGYPAVGRRGEEFKLLHRVRAEHALGRPLPPHAEVHHPDEDKTNPNARLVICQDSAYHKLLHFRLRIKRAGGNPNTERICSRCKSVKTKDQFNRSKLRMADGLDCFCRQCVREKNAIQKARRKGMAA